MGGMIRTLKFDIEEFAEGAALVFEALNTTMYSGEQITEETFHGMVRVALSGLLLRKASSLFGDQTPG